jgi:hypothetical protein
MTAPLEFRPMLAGDAVLLELQPSQHYELGRYHAAYTLEEGEELAENGDAWTAHRGSRIVTIAGFRELFPGHAVVWASHSAELGRDYLADHPLCPRADPQQPVSPPRGDCRRRGRAGGHLGEPRRPDRRPRAARLRRRGPRSHSVREDPIVKAVGMFAQGIAAYDSGKYTRSRHGDERAKCAERRRDGARSRPRGGAHRDGQQLVAQGLGLRHGHRLGARRASPKRDQPRARSRALEGQGERRGAGFKQQGDIAYAQGKAAMAGGIISGAAEIASEVAGAFGGAAAAAAAAIGAPAPWRRRRRASAAGRRATSTLIRSGARAWPTVSIAARARRRARFSGASPEAFGAAVGRGLEQAGDTLDRSIHQLRERDRDSQAADAGVELARASTLIDNQATDARSNAQPGGAGHSEGVVKSIDISRPRTSPGSRIRTFAKSLSSATRISAIASALGNMPGRRRPASASWWATSTSRARTTPTRKPRTRTSALSFNRSTTSRDGRCPDRR